MNISPTERRADKGFTLIELMVVVLIIAILLAIAIPTFLGAQNKAKDRSAQSSARNALTNAKTLYADTGSYISYAADGVTVVAPEVALTAIEPALTFVATTALSTGPKMVSVLATDTSWYAAVLSATGTCYYLRDSLAPATNPGTMYATGAKADCTATKAAAVGPVYVGKW